MKKNNPLDKFIKLLAKKLAVEIQKELKNPTVKGKGKISVWVSKDLEISQKKKAEDEDKMNRLSHPIV